MANILDGKQLAAQLRIATAAKVQAFAQKKIIPTLAVILVGDDPASQVYVKNKTAACAQVGIKNIEIRLPATTTEATIFDALAKLNADPNVHAILVQLPLPKQIDTQRVLAAVDPQKDVDGFHPINIGRLMLGLPGPRPCTPLGAMALIRAVGLDPTGQRAVVIGRSAIVGKPMAALLLAADATVTVCHSKTTDLAAIVREATIVVAAIGRPRFVQGDWIRHGATVIDVGINRLPDGSLTGDVDFAAASTRAAHITPVPGGVGPMTIAMLLQNTLQLTKEQSQ